MTERRTWWTRVAIGVALGLGGLAFRIWLGHGNGYPTDMAAFMEWADKGSREPLGEIYRRLAPNYPPASLTVFWLIGKLRSAFPVLVRPDLQYLSMKAPMFVVDLLTAWLIYVVAKPGAGTRRAGWAAVLYLFNPAVVSDSAIWGQTDGLVSLFPLVALVALDRGAWWAVGPCLAAALATKFQAVTLAVTLLCFVVADVGVLRAATTVAIGSVSFAAIAAPFVLTSGQFGQMIERAYVGNLSILPQLRFGALNLWDLLDPTITDDDWTLVVVHGIPITPKLLGLALFAIAWMPIMLAGCARRDVLGRAYAVGLVAWAFFMFPTRIHERYLLPAVAFFTVTAARGAPMALITAIAVTVIHLYSCFFRYSWAADTMVPMMRVLVVPTFLAALHHLRVETIDQPETTPALPPRRSAGWATALGAWATRRIGLSVAGITLACGCVALAVDGWFHARVGSVPLVRLAPDGPSLHTATVTLPDGHHATALRLTSGHAARVRLPPTFGTLRTAISIGAASPTDERADACAATFVVRAQSAVVWASEPVTAASGSRWVDIPLAPSDTEITLGVQATGCDADAVFDWAEPRLVAFRATRAWSPDDTIYLSDMASAAPWLRALVGGGVMRRDRSLQRGILTIGGHRYTKGLGVGADSIVEFAVPPDASELRTDLGFDDEVAAQRGTATLVFTVLVDGREAYRSGDVAPGRPALGVRVPVTGSRRVTLLVASPNATAWDHADWADARFVK